MIDIENAKKIFLNDIKNFDTSHKKFDVKVGHSFRVMNNCKMIATKLNMNEEEIEVAQLIGLLHDLAKLKQYGIPKENKKDHGDYAAEILKNNDYIRNYIKDNKYDNVILNAIANHNKYHIEEGLTSKELIFANIIRDADRIDIFYEMTEVFEISKDNYYNLIITDEILKDFMTNKSESIDKRKTKVDIDKVIWIISFIYVISFECSLEYLRNEDLINRMIDRFDYNKNLKIQMDEVKKIANNFIDEKLKKDD